MIKKNEKDGKTYYNHGIRYPKVDLPSKPSGGQAKTTLDDEIPF